MNLNGMAVQQWPSDIAPNVTRRLLEPNHYIGTEKKHEKDVKKSLQSKYFARTSKKTSHTTSVGVFY